MPRLRFTLYVPVCHNAHIALIFKLKGVVRTCCMLAVGMSVCVAPAFELQDLAALGLNADDLAEVLPLAMEALAISHRAAVREAKHKAELAKKGIAEVPASGSARYVMNAGLVGKFVFDNFGEFYIDRRFVTKDEMVTIKKIEAWLRGRFPDSAKGFDIRTEDETGAPRKVPIFRGFVGDGQEPYDRRIGRERGAFACGLGDGSAAGQCAGRLERREDAPRTQEADETQRR